MTNLFLILKNPFHKIITPPPSSQQKLSTEVENYRKQLQDIEKQVINLRKDRDTQFNKAQQLTSENNTLKSSFLPAVLTECNRLIQHSKKHVSSEGALVTYWFWGL